ncbi:uncharacterized protein L3040_005429 [Drepanopeziza brunnea f. sp. 'multigermtubi']|uniref:uncharacterized protein n=1 Tax=Drepanopeziza brunnea f. sp. 'multigermtubi' TaxID=698441 RepID=UPI0023936C41|nr:hypothetical protein L3040_005429 [Drepanopeziza brunnea f. sp. 'multigermtubi']
MRILTSRQEKASFLHPSTSSSRATAPIARPSTNIKPSKYSSFNPNTFTPPATYRSEQNQTKPDQNQIQINPRTQPTNNTPKCAPPPPPPLFPGSAASSTIESIVKGGPATGKTKCIECDGYECCCIPIPCTVM